MDKPTESDRRVAEELKAKAGIVPGRLPTDEQLRKLFALDEEAERQGRYSYVISDPEGE